MYSNVVLGVSHHEFEDILDDSRKAGRSTRHRARRRATWKRSSRYKAVEKTSGAHFPQDPKEQLWGAIGAVFASWMNDRAITYRRLNDIP
jgi:pyruvate,orthophosphate dikinase